MSFRHKYEHIPGIVIRPVDTADVAAALELAQQLGLQVTVKNGGHNPAGLCRQLGNAQMSTVVELAQHTLLRHWACLLLGNVT